MPNNEVTHSRIALCLLSSLRNQDKNVAGAARFSVTYDVCMIERPDDQKTDSSAAGQRGGVAACARSAESIQVKCTCQRCWCVNVETVTTEIPADLVGIATPF